MWPIQGPIGACGWAHSFSLRPFTLQARRQSSPPRPQSFSPRAPLMSNNLFWTLTQMTWTYTASGALNLSTLMDPVVKNCVEMHAARFWRRNTHVICLNHEEGLQKMSPLVCSPIVCNNVHVYCTFAGSSQYAQSLSACPARCGWCQIAEGSPTSWTQDQVGIIALVHSDVFQSLLSRSVTRLRFFCFVDLLYPFHSDVVHSTPSTSLKSLIV